MASEALVVPGDDSKYLALRMEQSELVDLIRENLGGDGLSPGDLDRIKVPAGGGISFSVPTIDGEEDTKELRGVIVDRATRRAYWPDSYDGSNDPPQCFSNDGQFGQGDPGGACSDCPFNEFGSAENGIGKACKETRQLFLLPVDSIIPLVVTLPPASLANAKSYFMRLLRGQLSPLDVETVITLVKDKNKGGIVFSKVELAAGDRLSPEAKERMREYSGLLQPAIEAASRIERDEVDD